MHEAPSRSDTASRVEAVPRTPRWAMLLPAVTLVAGIGIGALVAGAGGSGRGSATATPTATGPTTPAVSVQVPPECLQLAQDAGTALPNLTDVSEAIKSLDLQRLQALVSQLQNAQPRLLSLAQQCRDKAAGVQLVPAPAAS